MAHKSLRLSRYPFTIMKLEANFLVICCAVFAVNGNVVPEVPRLGRRAVRARPGEFPYYALLKYNGGAWCGGALISRAHVLTAAHCISRFISRPDQLRRLAVEIGTVSVGSGKTHMVRRLSQHRYYSGANNIPVINPNDIAVVTLSTPVIVSPGVRPISLPEPSQRVLVNSKASVCGFGSVESGQPSVRILRKAEMSLVSLGECQNYYKTTMNKRILPSQICASGGYGHGTCTGDSGSPLVHNDQVIGIVVAGDGRCSNGSPDIYTRVSHFIPYIQSEMIRSRAKEGSDIWGW